MTYSTAHWLSKFSRSERPAYLLLAELIEQDMEQGRLSSGDRLPTLRDLSEAIGLDYTTVARGYAEARKRGLIESMPGVGTYVKGSNPSLRLRGGISAEMTMNLPPEPRSSALLQRMRRSAAEVFDMQDFYSLLRYQEFGGEPADREAGARWLRRQLPGVKADQVLVSPGIHSVLLALVSQLVAAGEYLCVESVTYPGIKAIATQLGIKLLPLPMDDHGLVIEAFEEVCKSLAPKVLYCTPTIQNPTAITMPPKRREALVDVAQRYNVMLIEDDPYGMLPSQTPEPLALLAPELTYYVTGFSKCLGAGLRTAYVKSPDALRRDRLAATLRAFCVMASPVTNALATRWINEGVAEAMLDAVRIESTDRQELARDLLSGHRYIADPEGFHLWLALPEGFPPVEFARRLQDLGVWVVASAAFATGGASPQYVRVCLGGAMSWSECANGLKMLRDRLKEAA